MVPKLHVDIDPRQFTFENPRGEILALKTAVQVIKEKERWRLMRIGLDTWEGRPPETMIVNLFEDQLSGLEGINKLELLSVFMDYGIGESFQYHIFPVTFLRPIVIFQGISRFASLLHGYEKMILLQAAEAGGARKVIFE